jgi:hypothetical protein
VKSDFLEFIGNARQRRSEKFRHQLYIFLVCLVLSVFLWALVRLSKDYYFSVTYDLVYTDIPGSLKLTGVSDTTVTIRIKVQGFELISEKFLVSEDRVFEVSLRNLRLRYNGDLVRGYMLTSRTGKEIIAQSNFPNDVYFVSPDTLFFEFEKQSMRKVSPRPATGVTGSQAGMKDSIRQRPDSLARGTDSHKPGTIKH